MESLLEVSLTQQILNGTQQIRFTNSKQYTAKLLYKAKKPSPFVCLSVRSFLVEWISVVGARIGIKLA